MGICRKCGANLIERKRFCNKCGGRIKLKRVVEKGSKPWFISVVPLIIIVLLVFSYIIYYNRSLTQEREQEEARLSEAKRKQVLLDEEFSRQLQENQEKEKQIQQEQIDIQSKDEDDDGLTHAKELELGTDPNNPDTDSDGIRDNEDAHPAGGGENYKITIEWEHNGLPFQTQFGIPEDGYFYYKNQPRGWCCEGWEKFSTPTDITLKNIARDIVDVSLSTGESCKLCLAIDFVESMVYEYDIDYNNNQEYPKYAIETIIDKKGDCEDTSFLMASILESLGIDTIILLYSDHAAVGVECSDCSGTYYYHNGKEYYFLETTGAPGSWQIGEIWGKYGEESPGIIDVK